jgi:hypothetical protein
MPSFLQMGAWEQFVRRNTSIFRCYGKIADAVSEAKNSRERRTD